MSKVVVLTAHHQVEGERVPSTVAPVIPELQCPHIEVERQEPELVVQADRL